MNRQKYIELKKLPKKDFKIKIGSRVRFNPAEVENVYKQLGIEMPGDREMIEFFDGTVVGRSGPRWDIKWDNGFQFRLLQKYLYIKPTIKR